MISHDADQAPQLLSCPIEKFHLNILFVAVDDVTAACLLFTDRRLSSGKPSYGNAIRRAANVGKSEFVGEGD